MITFLLHFRDVVPRVPVGAVFFVPRSLRCQCNSILSTAQSQDRSFYSGCNFSDGSYMANHWWSYNKYVKIGDPLPRFFALYRLFLFWSVILLCFGNAVVEIFLGK